jgi:hypothetical protein
METKDLQAKLCIITCLPNTIERICQHLKDFAYPKEKGMYGFKQQYLRVRLHMI